MEDCLFCKIVRGEVPSQKVYEDDEVLAFMDIKPVNPGHVLVIPKVHSTNLIDIEQKDAVAMFSIASKLAPKVAEAVESPGFNIAMNNGEAAGQVVMHPHVHIIPRNEGDGYGVWHGPERSMDEIAGDAEKIRVNLDS